MQVRKLKKLLNDTGYIVHETSEHICVGSPYCSDLLSVNKDTLKLKYALDTFRDGKSSLGNPELRYIWDRLEKLIKSGEIKDIIARDDVIENPLPVFSHDENYNIVESVTDEYGWPNTDIKGCLMYDNQWFPTKQEAIEKALSGCDSEIKWREDSVREKQQEINKNNLRIEIVLSAKKHLTDVEVEK